MRIGSRPSSRATPAKLPPRRSTGPAPPDGAPDRYRRRPVAAGGEPERTSTPPSSASRPRCPAAARTGPARSRWPRRWPGPSRTGATWWCRPAPAPARRSPTSCPRILSGRRVRGGHGHQGAAGPAGRQGPARSSPSTSTSTFDVRGAQGPVELRLPPAGAPRSPGRRPARARRARRPRRRRGRAAPARRVGRRDRRPATGPSSTSSRRPTAWAAVSVSRQGVPGRGPLPEGRRVLRRAGPPAGRQAPTWSSSTPTSTGCTSRRAA